MRGRRVSRVSFAGLAIMVALSSLAQAAPVLHEPIGSDPRDDLALGVGVDGDLPAAIDTPSGLVAAPDPDALPSTARPHSGSDLADLPPDATFHADRDTRRPDVLPYEDPFTPSTAPFKRLLAFDSVDAQYTLAVHDSRLVPLSANARAATDGSDELFYANVVVDLAPNRRVRIPSVGPGSKVLHARAGVGSADVPVKLWHDGADNWFVEGETSAPMRARLVMELAIPRSAFGGELGDPAWSDLPKIAPLPPIVSRAAAEVAAHIGVSRAQAPRDVLTKLVGYFRSFADSDAPPPSSGDIYLDLALSKKGVCRHRAFAFLVTALGLGLPTRMIANEAHAWVEVNDGSQWRRIDLGGAGRALDASLSDTVKYSSPADPFAWPASGTRGEDLADRARAQNASPGSSGGASNAAASGGGGGGGTENGPRSTSPGSQGYEEGASRDERPTSHVSLGVSAADARRGGPVRVKGDVKADGEPCSGVAVDVALKDAKGEIALGSLATDANGNYEGALFVPAAARLGDYDVVARTSGSARCGRGNTP